MSTPTLASPNVDNVQVGKGVVSFKKTGDSVFRLLGNVTQLTVTPEVTTLEHFSSQQGTKKKDLVIILEQKATAKIVMEEITADNLALMVYGNVNASAVGGPEVEIFANSAITGQLRFVGTNDVGPKITVDLYNVSFTPTGDLGFISDEFNSMEVSADVLAASSGGAQATGQWTGTAIADTETMTINGVVYTFQTTLTSGAGHVHLGGNLLQTLQNLVKAINLTGVSGTDYGVGTVIHPDVIADSDATHLNLTAKVGGTAGNSITTVDAITAGAFANATLTGGTSYVGKFGVAKFTNVTPAP